jgi:hypothetical protein
MKRVAAFVVACALIAASVTKASADLIVNGGFETGNLTGWSCSASLCQVDTLFVHSGTYDFNGYANGQIGDLSQIIATTPGVTYDLSFWTFDDEGYSINTLQYSIGGTFGTSNNWRYCWSMDRDHSVFRGLGFLH